MTSMNTSMKFNNYGTMTFPANTEVNLPETSWVYTSYGSENQDDPVGEEILPDHGDSFVFAEANSLWNVNYNLNLDYFALTGAESLTCKLKYVPGTNSSDTAFETIKTFTASSTESLITNNIQGNAGDKLYVTLTCSVDKTVNFDEGETSPSSSGGDGGFDTGPGPQQSTMTPCSITIEKLIEGVNDLFYQNENGTTSQLVKGATTTMTLVQKLTGGSVTFILTQDGTLTGKPRLTEKITSKTVNISTNSTNTGLTPPSQMYWLEEDSTTSDITSRTLVFGSPGSASVDWIINCTFRGL